MVKKRFKIGDQVNGISFDGKSILGEYRGGRNSYGVYVFGVEQGSTAPPQLYICPRLSLERQKPVLKAPKKRNKQFLYMDQVTAQTTKFESVTGFFANSEGKFSYVRGWLDGVSRHLPKQTYRVLSSTIREISP